MMTPSTGYRDAGRTTLGDRLRSGIRGRRRATVVNAVGATGICHHHVACASAARVEMGNDAERRRAEEAVAAWTRERFSLPPEAPMLVTEGACTLPGGPPRETVVVFRAADGRRHRFRIFKRVQSVLPDDLPFAWMTDALAIADDLPSDCC